MWADGKKFEEYMAGVDESYSPSAGHHQQFLQQQQMTGSLGLNPKGSERHACHLAVAVLRHPFSRG